MSGLLCSCIYPRLDDVDEGLLGCVGEEPSVGIVRTDVLVCDDAVEVAAVGIAWLHAQC